MRSTSDYTLHPKDDGTCFVCGNERHCFSYLPARTVESEGPFYKIALCRSHGSLYCVDKFKILTIEALIRRFGSVVKYSNRIPGHEINEFCRLTTTDIERGYVVHPSVTSFKCFYCGMEALGQRDKSPTIEQLLISRNFDKPRYVVPCCSTCRSLIRYHVPEMVPIEERKEYLARRSKHDKSPCISNSIWD